MSMSVTVTRVWVRSLGNACRVRVEDSKDVSWLLDQLALDPTYTSLKDLDLSSSREKCLISIPNSAGHTLTRLEEALAAIPGVQLMLEPESI